MRIRTMDDLLAEKARLKLELKINRLETEKSINGLLEQFRPKNLFHYFTEEILRKKYPKSMVFWDLTSPLRILLVKKIEIFFRSKL